MTRVLPPELVLPDDPKLRQAYWKPPGRPKAGTGDSSGDILFHSVGSALTQWGMAESALAFLFGVVAERKRGFFSDSPARVAWGFIEAVGPRVDLISKISQGFWTAHPETRAKKARFASLLEHTKPAARIRNDIAHGIVTNHTHAPGFYLHAPDFVSGRNDLYGSVSDVDLERDPIAFTTRAFNVYKSEDLKLLAFKFSALNSSIMTLGFELFDIIDPLPAGLFEKPA